MTVHHINCGALKSLPGDENPRSIVHCLLVEHGSRLLLVDSGFGLAEMRDPPGLLSREAVEFWGIAGGEQFTATREIERLGFDPAAVTDIVLTHGDVDHCGGLADFPLATVHISAEELAALTGTRYVARQFAHGPRFHVYESSSLRWHGLEARRIQTGNGLAMHLVPLPGHTTGHCGVAIEQESGWLLHAGDSYYRRLELTDPEHPVAKIPMNFADDNAARLRSLQLLRRLIAEQGEGLKVFSSHDVTEYQGAANWPQAAA